MSTVSGEPTGKVPALEAALVRAAVAGDQDAFARLVDDHRRALLAHCYRLLGSITEAEDMVQETLLRAWTRLETFRGQASLRTWLYRIATNVCLDAIARSKRRVLPAEAGRADDPSRPPRPPATEIAWLEPYPDDLLEEIADGAPGPGESLVASEAIEIAFLAALQHVPPRQRAILVLRDVLQWSATEVAALLDTSVVSVNSALQRARETLGARLPEGRRGLAEAPLTDDPEQARILREYARAWEEADVEALVGLLREDATLSMPPSPSWYAGRAAIGIFFRRSVFGDEGCHPAVASTRLVATRANGGPAFGVYQWNEATGDYRPFAIKALSLSGGEIASIVSFLDDALFRYFALPASFAQDA